jgi:hypothetical protein
MENTGGKLPHRAGRTASGQREQRHDRIARGLKLCTYRDDSGGQSAQQNSAVIARLDRATQYAAAYRINFSLPGVLDPRKRVACAGMTSVENRYTPSATTM